MVRHPFNTTAHHFPRQIHTPQPTRSARTKWTSKPAISAAVLGMVALTIILTTTQHAPASAHAAAAHTPGTPALSIPAIPELASASEHGGNNGNGISHKPQGQTNSATLEFAAATYTFAEGNSAVVQVSLSAPLQDEVVIPIHHQFQTASANDYWRSPNDGPLNLTFPAGYTTNSFVIGGSQDTVDEPTETLTLSFGTLPSGVTAGTTSQAAVQIVDDDYPSVTLQFENSSYSVQEGQSVNVNITLDREPERPLVIPLRYYPGAGLSDRDFSGLPSNLIFSSNEMSKTVILHGVDNGLDRPDKTMDLFFGLELPHLVSEGTNQRSTVTIVDDDLLQLTATMPANAFTIGEGGTHTIEVSLSESTNRVLNIPIVHQPLDGGNSSDYTVSPSTLTFNVGDSSKSFVVGSVDDNNDDSGKSFQVSFGTLPGGVHAGQPSLAVVSIADDDFPRVTVKFADTSYSVTENSGVRAAVILVLDQAPDRSLWIPFTITHQNGATAAEDYFITGSGGNFGPADTQTIVYVSARRDGVDDDGESLLLSLDNLPDRVTAALPNQTTVHIDDRDVPAVVLSLATTSYDITEGETANVIVTMDKDPERPVTVSLVPSDPGETPARAGDYTITPSSRVYNTGRLSHTFTVTAVDDDIDEGEFELLNVHIEKDPDDLLATVDAGKRSAQIKIIDNDEPQVTVSSSSNDSLSPVIMEGSSDIYRFSVRPTPTYAFTVPIQVTHGRNVNASDYTLSKTELTFGPTQTQDAVTITASSGDLREYQEELHISLGTPTNELASVMANTQRIKVIIRDPNPPEQETVPNFTVTLITSNDTTVEEGHSGTFYVNVSPTSEHVLTAQLTITNQGGATSDDYEPISTSVTIPVGTDSHAISFNPVVDDLVETGEGVHISMSMAYPDRYFAGPSTSVTMDITDLHIGASTVEFDRRNDTVTEGDSTTVTVLRAGDLDGSYTINVRGRASSGGYTTNQQLVFTLGDTEKSFSFTTPDDADDQPNPNITFEFVNLPAGVTTGASDQLVLTVREDEDFPIVRAAFDNTAYSVNEGSSITISITLNEPPQQPASFRVTAAPNSYISTPLEFTMAADQTLVTFDYMAPNDYQPNLSDYWFQITIEPTSHVRASSNYGATVYIRDIDPSTVKFEPSLYSVDEGNSVPVTVQLDRAATQDLSIPITASSTRAVSSDYSVPGAVAITAGSKQGTFQFMASDDEVDDGTETVTLGFGGTLPNGLRSIQSRSAVVTIADDPQDFPNVAVRFDSSSRSIQEGDSATITVSLTKKPEREVEITVSAENVGGTSDTDYSLSATTLTFGSEETSKSFTFSANTDSDEETGNKVRLSFGTLPRAVTAGSPSTTTISINEPANDTEQVDQDLSIGSSLHGWWQEPPQNSGVTANGNVMQHTTCAITEKFTVIWTGNDSVADEYQASISGSPTVTHTFEDTDRQSNRASVTGSATFTGAGIFSIKVRARFGTAWSPWTNPATMYCNTN